LDSGSAGIQDSNDGDFRRESKVHHLDDFVPGNFAEGTAKDGEILAKHRNLPTHDGAHSGDNGISIGPLLVHAKSTRAVSDELIQFHERTSVQEQSNALTRRELSLRVLLLLSGGLTFHDSFVKAGAVVRNPLCRRRSRCLWSVLNHDNNPSRWRASPQLRKKLLRILAHSRRSRCQRCRHGFFTNKRASFRAREA